MSPVIDKVIDKAPPDQTTKPRDPRNYARAPLLLGKNGTRRFLVDVMVYDVPHHDRVKQCGFSTGFWPQRAQAKRLADHWKDLLERPDYGTEKWCADKAALLAITLKSRDAHFKAGV
ncbi:hypothetical protein DES40_1755 [Litorimonas taeanensis]|uniref:Uncharacterized protein n=1 Tax=Litorimonas taeanensis TaxID=568099 RepID=A0A420WD80_9PROT|nr:hypothetical protein [Litorimonas taeanensis]RKQ68979.1 hypothetical protein DES40_1755 [Litorimonas taeanensis]